MRISIFTPNFPPELSGMAIQSLNLATNLAQRNHSIKIVAFTPKNDIDSKYTKLDLDLEGNYNIKVYRVKRSEKINLSTLKILKKVIEWTDIVNVHGYTLLTTLGFVLSRIIKKKNYCTPFCITLHGGESTFYKKKNFFDIPKYIYEHSESIVSVSSYIGKLLVSKGIKIKPKTIYTGIKYEHFNKKYIPFEKRDNTILIVKGLYPRSEIQDLIQAFNIISSEFKNLRLQIIGDGPCRGEYEKLTCELNLKDKISFLGWIDNEKLPEYFANAILFVLPSSREELGIPLIESASTGTPVIATDVGGPTELINNGNFGLLCSPNNPQELAEKIRTILNNRDKWEMFSKNGMEYAKKFNWNIITDEYENLFQKLIHTNYGSSEIFLVNNESPL